jgi:hypothetical protein
MCSAGKASICSAASVLRVSFSQGKPAFKLVEFSCIGIQINWVACLEKKNKTGSKH